MVQFHMYNLVRCQSAEGERLIVASCAVIGEKSHCNLEDDSELQPKENMKKYWSPDVTRSI